MAVLPMTLMIGVSPLTVLHIYPIVLKRIDDIKEIEVDNKFYVDSGIVPIQPKDENHYKKPLHMKPSIFTGVVIFVGCFVIHIFSIMAFIQYGNEVLSSENYHNIIPIILAGSSLLAIGAGFVLTAKLLKLKISKSKDDTTIQPSQIPAAVISVNCIYIGCYFLPYMLLAFIHHPLLTTFTYLKLTLLIVCIYLICLGVWNLYKFYKEKKARYDDNIKHQKLLDSIFYSCMVWAIALSLVMFIFVVSSTIALGKFDDYKELEYLVPSLPLALIGLFILKPAKKSCVTNTKATNSVDRQAEEGGPVVRNYNTNDECLFTETNTNSSPTKSDKQLSYMED